MKKRINVLPALVLAAAGSLFLSLPGKAADQPLSIVTTVFPEYDWVRQILGENTDNVQLTLLLDQGVDLHSYQPGAKDILTISSCDLLVYVGGESDKWIYDILEEPLNPDMVTVNLLEILGSSAAVEEIPEGAAPEAGHDPENPEDPKGAEGSKDPESPENSEDPEYDEHVWLSLKNAAVFCDAIVDALEKTGAVDMEACNENAEAYKASLSELDRACQEAVDASPLKTLLFGDRFPFLYLARDYDLSCYAAFEGCSAETEASFDTIIFLAEKIDELGLPAILTIEGNDGKIAAAIRDATRTRDQKILCLDSMQAVTAQDIDEGVTYLSVMKDNLPVLREALTPVQAD